MKKGRVTGMCPACCITQMRYLLC
uniref:Uncharacterized protein n=1 Tax=Anguilla anguilla TaxID=7936 RepID=A0A0E9WBJ2_ANGAN